MEKAIKELEKKIEEKKKIPIRQCPFCALSEEVHQVELLIVQRETLKEVLSRK